MIVQEPKPKQLLRPITTGADGAMNQSQFLAITCNSLKAREKLRVHGAIGFGFASHWLKNWRESLKPITKRSNRNHVITFDSHLKTALLKVGLITMTKISHLDLLWKRDWGEFPSGMVYCLAASFLLQRTLFFNLSSALAPQTSQQRFSFRA